MKRCIREYFNKQPAMERPWGTIQVYAGQLMARCQEQCVTTGKRDIDRCQLMPVLGVEKALGYRFTWSGAAKLGKRDDVRIPFLNLLDYFLARRPPPCLIFQNTKRIVCSFEAM